MSEHCESFAELYRKQKKNSQLNIDAIIDQIEEEILSSSDTLTNGDFESFLEFAAEPPLWSEANKLHRLLSNIWTLPDVLSSRQKSKLISCLVENVEAHLDEHSAFVAVDAMKKVAEQSEWSRIEERLSVSSRGKIVLSTALSLN